MSFQAMTWATDQKLPAMQKIVLLMMANRFNEYEGYCWPSHELLAEECGMDKRSVIRQIEKLHEAGIIEIVKTKYTNKMNAVNKYRLNMDIVGELKLNRGRKFSSDRESLRSDRESLGVVTESHYAVTQSHQGSDRESLGVVTESHQGSDRESLKTINEPVIQPVIETINSAGAKSPVSTSGKTEIKKTAKTILEEFGITGDLASDFITLRNAKKAPITKTAMDGIESEANKAGISIEEAIRICCQRNWQGFKAEWIKNAGQSLSSVKPTSTGYQPSIFAQVLNPGYCADFSAIDSTSQRV